MNWLRRALQRLRLRRGIRRIGAVLAKSYGRSHSYTPAQIRRAALGVGLTEQDVITLYACYLSEQDFSQLHAGSPFEGS